jgi:methionyl-tRNA formyltransferase
MEKNNIKFVFFGTSLFSVHVLNALKNHNILPFAIVTFPDRPKGRKLIPTPNVVKTWAEVNNVKILETLTLKNEDIKNKIKEFKADLFVVASFGRILPEDVIYMPKFKTLNVHPSLLPEFRGPAPIQEAILTNSPTGVSIMRLDEGVDTGPILAQEKLQTSTWPLYYKEAEEKLGTLGGNLLASVIPKWIKNELEEIPQDNSLATHTRMILRTDGDITIDSPEIALNKIMAFEVWPRTFLFHERKDGEKELLIVKKAHIEEGKLIPDIIIPAGRKEMQYKDYIRGN